MQIVPRKKDQPQPVSLRDAMNRLFDESFWDPFPSLWGGERLMSRQFVPDMDVSETEKEIKVTADVPGYDPKDIDVTLNDSVLTISGTMAQEKEEEDKKQQWHCRQCASGSFVRQFSLPRSVQEDKISCKAKNGKLTIVIPKKKEEAIQGKKLTIDVE